MNKATIIIVSIVIVLAVGAGAFYGGMVYGKSQATTASPEELMAQLRAQRGGQFPGAGQGQADTGGRTGGLGGTMGTIESIDGNTVIISTNDGPVKILAEGPDNSPAKSIYGRVAISVERHGSKVVAVVAHHDCAGNPRPKAEQLVQLRTALKTVEGWGFDVSVLGLWVDENWTVEKVEQERVQGV